ncbi:MAG: hypothetical protein EU549_03520 [Promethearchaeota archaeon]|nr:MAG: hypothetical protein EU549_03520 [Candidatus Lokiarchaeota archaeon]
MKEKEFIVNESLKVRLENGKSVIYINDEPFRTCVSIFIEDPSENFTDYTNYESIDAINFTNPSVLEILENESEISSESLFWVHCSNLQVWAENNYDTRLLHSQVSFPILKQLSQGGNLEAREAYKLETIKRFKTCYPWVFHYIVEECIDDFPKEEIIEIYNSINLDDLKHIKDFFPDWLQYRIELDILVVLSEYNKDAKERLIELILETLKSDNIENIGKVINEHLIKSLDYDILNINFDSIDKNLSEKLILLTYIIFLKDCVNRDIEKAEKILRKIITRVFLENNFPIIQQIIVYKIWDIVSNKEKINLVKFLDYNVFTKSLLAKRIRKILESFFNLLRSNIDINSLKEGYITYNNERYAIYAGILDLNERGIKKISEIKGLETLKNSQELYLSGNEIDELQGLENLTTLKGLHLNENQITEIKGLEMLTNLKELSLESNQITEIKGLEMLNKLEFLNLSWNKITEIKGLQSLENLKIINIANNRINDEKEYIKLLNMEHISDIYIDILNFKSINLRDKKNIESLLNEKGISSSFKDILNKFPDKEY